MEVVQPEEGRTEEQEEGGTCLYGTSLPDATHRSTTTTRGETGREGEREREREEFEKEISLKPNSLRARKCLSIIQFRTNDIDDVTILIGIYINVST